MSKPPGLLGPACGGIGGDVVSPVQVTEKTLRWDRKLGPGGN